MAFSINIQIPNMNLKKQNKLMYKYNIPRLIILTSFLLLLGCRNTFAQKMSIDDAVRIAVDNNNAIRLAKINIEKEEAVKLRSFNIPRPELFIEFEGVKGSLKNFESRKIGVLQELEFPTNYFLRADMQESQVNTAKEELNKIVRDTKYEVKIAYLSLLLNIELLESAENNLKIFIDFLFVAQKKYDAGSTGNLELLGARVNKIKYENEIKNIRSEITRARSELSRLMNIPDLNIEPADRLQFPEVRLDKAELLKKALSENPDLKINKFRKKKFSNKLSLTKSELLPNFSFRYYTQKIGNDADFWGMELGVGLPLWFWWEQTGNIKEAGYELDIAAGEEQITIRELENDINRAYEEFQNSSRQADFFRMEAMPESDEILRQSKTSYEEGAIDYVEYLQALQIIYDTRTQYLNSLFMYHSAITKLEKLTGGDIK